MVELNLEMRQGKEGIEVVGLEKRSNGRERSPMRGRVWELKFAKHCFLTSSLVVIGNQVSSLG